MRPSARAAIFAGTGGGLLALALLVIALVTQGSQGIFQINRPSADYAALLIARDAYLRLDLGVDFVFLTFYAATGLSLAVWIADMQRGEAGNLMAIASGYTGAAGLVTTALLDTIENTHILALLSLAQQGQVIPQSDIVWQMAESQTKFVISYFALFIMSFALPQNTLIEKFAVFFLRWVQLPVGIAIFVVPSDIVRPFYLARAISFVVGLLAVAYIVYNNEKSRRAAA
jgi:hypothetical protein